MKGWFLRVNMGKNNIDDTDDDEDEQLPIPENRNNASDVLWENGMKVYFRNKPLFYIHPIAMEDSITIISKLKEKNSVVIDFYDLSQSDYNQWQRTVDFLYGAVYALNAEAKRYDKYRTILLPNDCSFNDDEISRIFAQDRINIKED